MITKGYFLEYKMSSLRPRLDRNEHRPMKRMDAKKVKPYLNEREKRVAWKLGSIDLEGWYSPENPSAIHCRIYDLPKGRYKYKFCPTCQEYIVDVAREKVVQTKRFEYPTRLTIYRCFCCDYQSEEREKIVPKRSQGLRNKD